MDKDQIIYEINVQLLKVATPELFDSIEEYLEFAPGAALSVIELLDSLGEL